MSCLTSVAQIHCNECSHLLCVCASQMTDVSGLVSLSFSAGHPGSLLKTSVSQRHQFPQTAMRAVNGCSFE